MAGSNHFPSELMHSILSRLPTKSLLRFQIISKSWHANMRDPYFIKLHMDQCRKSRSDNLYIGYYESGFCGFFEIENRPSELFVLNCPFASPGKNICLMCSCNGVLLFKIMGDKTVVTECVIWNPYSLSQKWRRIMCTYRTFNYNLCYDEARDDLKIVGFYNNWCNSEFVGCVVYSCRNDTWELKFCEDEVDWSGGQISFRGAVYCIVNSRDKLDESLATDIIRYDPSSDVWHSFPTPNYSTQYLQLQDSCITASKESLYFYVNPGDLHDVFLRIWVMKDDYSWEHLMTIDYGHVEGMEWPMSLHFPNGRNDFVIETESREMYLVDINKRSNYIGEVLGDVKGLLINHPTDTLYFPVIDVPSS